MKKNTINRYGYSGLLIIHILIILFTVIKKRDRKTLIMSFFNVVGLAFYFEYPLYISKAYQYKTKLIKNKEQDNSLGSIFSQAIFVPSVGIFISAFKLNWVTKFLFVLYFVVIEKIFLKLKIYNNRWWKTGYTAIFIYISFFISDISYKQLKKGNRLVFKMVLYNSFHVLYMSAFFLLSLFKSFRFEPVRSIKKPWYFHYGFVKVYLTIETCITVYFYEKNRNNRILPLSIVLALDYILIKIKLLRTGGTYWTSLFPIRLFMHLLLSIAKKYMGKQQSNLEVY